VLVPSTADPSTAGELDSAAHQILLLNCADWPLAAEATVFDFTTMQTPFASDRIHNALRLFMKRYYGIKFVERVEN
jgi:hypothetical protein